MSAFPKNYKVSQQRVWPFPSKIKKGGQTLVISRPLTRRSISGLGASLLDQKVIEEFNSFVFYGTRPRSAIVTNYSIEIKTSDSLSSPEIDESYELNIQLDGYIKIVASNYIGASHALTTLSQLIRYKGKGEYVIENAPLSIKDKPGVSHREIMLDCSRHFLPPGLIKKQIRAMAFQKLNVLHLHLTDGQSFPLKLKPYSHDLKDDYVPLKNGDSYTETIALGKSVLPQDNIGAFSEDEVYTNRDIEGIVEYAKIYGIKVMPEIDTPGHTYSWMYGFPEIMTCNEDLNQTDECCPEPPCGFFNLKDKLSNVKKVVVGVFSEVIKAFKLGQEGYGSFFHLGFDEVGCPIKDASGECISPSCEKAYGQYSSAYLKWLFDWFNSRHTNLTTVLWIDQILASNFNAKGEYKPVIAPDPSRVIMQFWTLDNQTVVNQIKQMADHGYSLLNSQATVYYLDAGGQGNTLTGGGPIISKSGTKYNYKYQKNWISAYPGVAPSSDPNAVSLNNGWQTSFEDIYLNNITYLPTDARGPLSNGKIDYVTIPLRVAGSGGIIGAGVCLWGEQIDETNLEQKLWPKASSFAEALWKFDANQLADNIINAKYRLLFTREDLLRLGVQAAPQVPGDVFRKVAWGPLESNTTDLMHDVNDVMRQQIPQGYIFSYWSHWYTGSFCKSASVDPINPFCGPTLSKYMTCDASKKADYIQPLCPPEKQQQ